MREAPPSRPWTPEREVSAAEARRWISAQFGELRGARVELLAAGWDNTAFQVQATGEEGDASWVFRFPRRAIAAELVRTEARVLPAIAPDLPLLVPVPEKLGQPLGDYPWPWIGYRFLAGTTADRLAPDDEARVRAAEPLGRFLAALHAIPAERARAAGAGPDRLGRLDLGRRSRQVRERLAEARRSGLIAGEGAWDAILADLPADWVPGDQHLVHGDLYARHLLLGDDGTPKGVIDWGDVHLGDPAVDLSVAHGYLPRRAHAAFRSAYGPIDDDAWRVARLRALHSAVTVLVYAAQTRDQALLREAQGALERLRTN